MGIESKLGIGTVQFGVSYGASNPDRLTSPEEVSEILKLARTRGILLIDTASAYGISEEVLGKNDLKGFRIVSKFMPPENGEKIYDQLVRSLSRLKIPSLYGYLAHRPMNVLENPSQWKELNDLKTKGLVKKIGFSLNEPSELEKLLSQGFVPDLIQIPFSYFDRRFTKHLVRLNKEGCEIHARSVFLRGLFFRDVDKLNPFFDEIKPYILDLQKNAKCSPAALLRFVAGQTFINNVIFGVKNPSQFKENLENINSDMPLPEFNILLPEEILMPSKWPKDN